MAKHSKVGFASEKVTHKKDAKHESMVSPEEDLEEAPDVEEVYAGGGSNVVKEAKGAMRKRGGSVKHHEHEAEGEERKHHAGRKPRRASGGKVGAERHPFSGAATMIKNHDHKY